MHRYQTLKRNMDSAGYTSNTRDTGFSAIVRAAVISFIKMHHVIKICFQNSYIFDQISNHVLKFLNERCQNLM